MSRGPGKIERAIAAVFASDSDWAFTVEDLCEAVFSGCSRVDKKHRVSLLRAAKKVCARSVDWTWLVSGGIGGTLVFFNKHSPQSYGAARIKGDFLGNNYRANDPRRLRYPHWKSYSDADVRARLAPGGPDYRLIVAGGVWWGHVQMNIAERDRDTSPDAVARFHSRNAYLVSLGLPPEPLPDYLARAA